jgi:hypothetical protein
MPEPDGGPGAPEGRPPERRGARRSAASSVAGAGGAGERATRAAWADWVRAHRGLAAALVVFCLAAVVGALASLPRGFLASGRVSRPATGASATQPRDATPAASAERPTSRIPEPAASKAPAPEPAVAGPWVEEAATAASSRGLALVYRYRTLPPGGESRYEWIIQLRGARPVLDGVDAVSWRMEPAAKNGTDFVSRDRAADGFPLFGHGPGGWFGVTATVRYQDGGEESLHRRIEFPD